MQSQNAHADFIESLVENEMGTLIEKMEFPSGITAEIHYYRGQPDYNHDDLVSIAYADDDLGMIRGNKQVSATELNKISDRVQHGELIGKPVYVTSIAGSALLCSEPFDTQHGKDVLKEYGDKPDETTTPYLSGYAVIEKEDAVKEWGADYTLEQAMGRIESSIREFNCITQGQVYGFVLLDENKQEIDSGWGYVGDLDFVRECAEASGNVWEQRILAANHTQRPS